MELGKKGTTNKSGARYFVPRCHAVLSEPSTNTSSKRTAASVVSGSTTSTTQRSQKSLISIAIQTELTWLQGADTPAPVKTNSQTTQTHNNQNSAKKHRNTTSPSPPPRSNRSANAPIPSTSKGGQGDPQPPPSSLSSKKKAKQNKPSPSTHRCPVAMYSRYGYWMWRAGATRTPSSPLVLFLSCLLSNGTCVVCRPTERSSVYFYLNMIPQPFAYKNLFSIVTKQLPSKIIHTMVYLLWKIMALFMVV